MRRPAGGGRAGDAHPRPGPPVGLTTAPRYGEATGPGHRGPASVTTAGTAGHAGGSRGRDTRRLPALWRRGLSDRRETVCPWPRGRPELQGCESLADAQQLARRLSCGWTWPVAWGGRAVPEDGRVGVGLRSMRTAWGQARGERARGQPSHLPGRLSQLLKLGTPQQRRPDPCQPGREGVAGEPPRPLGRAGREVLCRRGHGRAGAWRPAGGEERAPSPAEGDANTRQLLPSRQFAQGPLLRGGAAPGRPAPGRLASWRTWGDGASGLLGPGGSGGKRGVGRQGPRRPRRCPRRSRSLPPHPPSEQSRPSSCLQGAPGSPWVCIILSF